MALSCSSSIYREGEGERGLLGYHSLSSPTATIEDERGGCEYQLRTCQVTEQIREELQTDQSCASDQWASLQYDCTGMQVML